ncbi:hypothetical protein FRC01_012227 [Tulasnella sp. 417]|nr:hypothetical protein FRC01_012227 [Tulasnella sp. 417]
MLPCRLSDFNSAVSVYHVGQQNSTLIPTRSTSYSRTSTIVSVYTAPPFNQDQHQPTPKYPYGSPKSTASSNIDARETTEFQVLDNLIRSLIASLPKEFKYLLPTELGSKLDPVQYTAHLLPHVTMILLQEPHADVGSPDCLSSRRILSAAQSILELVYKRFGTAYDLIYLDHACSFGWFVAGAALIRFLKAQMGSSNNVEVERITKNWASSGAGYMSTSLDFREAS